VANNVSDEGRIADIRRRTADLDMDFLGSVPHDPAVERMIFEGRSLFELDSCPAVLKIDELMSLMKE